MISGTENPVLKLALAAVLTLAVPLSASADTATEGTELPQIVVSESGIQTKVVAVRALPDGLRGAAVEIITDHGVMAMEYGFACLSDEYTYLGMIHDGEAGMLDDATVTKLQGYGDSIIGDNLRGVTLTPLSDDPLDNPIRELMALACS